MNPRFWFAAASYLVIMFIGAAGWHLVVFKNLYVRLGAFSRSRPIIALGLLAMLLQALVVAYLYPFFYRGGSPPLAGAMFGLLMGLFLGSNAVLAEAGKTQISPIGTWIVFEGIFYLVQFTVVGAVIGAIYGRLPGGAV